MSRKEWSRLSKEAREPFEQEEKRLQTVYKEQMRVMRQDKILTKASLFKDVSLFGSEIIRDSE